MFIPSHESRDSLTWPGLLDRAASPDALLDVVRDFMATVDPAELARLAPACYPPARFFVLEDVVDYAFALALHHCGVGSGDAVVRRLTTFFANASERAAMLMDPRESPARNDQRYSNA